jgi:hypothetical protein
MDTSQNKPAFALTTPKGGLIQWVLAAHEGLSSQSPALQERVLSLLEACYDPDGEWPFRENPDRDAPFGMETLSWALLCLQHLGVTDWIAEIRENGDILAKIDAYYDPDLMIYRDENTQKEGHIGAWRFHNDHVMRMGLEIMGVAPRPEPRGLERREDFPWAPQSDDELEAWLKRCWDYDPRSGTKEIIQYLRLYWMLVGGPTLDPHTRRILSFLAERRDPATGYIGIPKSGDVGWAMRGHRNNILHTLMTLGLREPVEAETQIMESTLALQRKDGLFHDGGMCANMDALEILAAYYLQTGYAQDLVLKTARRCIQALFERLYVPSAGGFLYKGPEAPLKDGYGDAWLVNGAAFVLNTIRYWQAIDRKARFDLDGALGELGVLEGLR